MTFKAVSKAHALAAIIALTTGLVAGCATTPDRIEPGDMRAESKHYATVVRLIDKCPSEASGGVKPMINPAVGAAVSLVADTVTKWIGAKLKEREEGLTVTYIGRGAGQAPGCLIVARGLHGALGADVSESANTTLKKDMLQKIGLADYPDLYFEAAISNSKEVGETVAYGVTPKLLYFRNTAAKYTEDGQKSLLLSVHMSAAQTSAAKAGEGESHSLMFAFDNVPMGVEINPIAGQTAALAIPKAMQGQTLNLLAQITETEDPSLLAKAFAESFDENKADISKALEEILTRAFSKAKEKTKDE